MSVLGNRADQVTGDIDVVVAPKSEGKKERPPKPFWLDAWRDHLAGVKSFSSCLEVADVNGDGDYKLLVGDASRKLKVFSGVSLGAESPLMTVPTAVRSFYMDYRDEVRRPNVAVASGPFIFIYKNLRPFYNFTLPPMHIADVEMAIWTKLRDGGMEWGDAYAQLEAAKDEGTRLSTRSIDFLACDTAQSKFGFVDIHKGTLPSQQTVITCMEVLLKDKDEAGGLGCLVVGTEDNQVLILDSTGASIVKKFKLPSAPVFILTAGLFDVEYRLLISCRDGIIYCVKNHQLQTTTIIPEASPVGLARYENLVAVATMNNALHFFHVKGRKHSSIYMPCPITNLCSTFNEQTRQCKAVVVALNNGEVRVYAGKSLLNTTQVYDEVSAIKFGRYGREDSTLVVVLKSGAVLLKMLPRSTVLEANMSRAPGAPPEQDIPLNVPKRTNLYIEQTEREKQFGVDMHRVFQRDLCKLRLTTAKAYVQMMEGGTGTTSHMASSSIRLTAQVHGLGPLFKVNLNLQNYSSAPLYGLPVVLSFNPEVYKVPKPCFVIPSLVPSLLYDYDFVVECVDPNGAGDTIKICVCSPTSPMPILTASVEMPPTDILVQS